VVSARKEEPTIVPLTPPDQVTGRTLACGDDMLVIQGVRDVPAQGTPVMIDVTIMTNDPPINPMAFRRRRWDFQSSRYDRIWSQLDIVDAQGRSLTFWADSQLRVDLDGIRASLLVRGGRDTGPPAQIRTYDVIKTTTDVEFEFRDIPLR